MFSYRQYKKQQAKNEAVFRMEICFICFMAGLFAMDAYLGNFYLLGGV